MAFLAIPLGLPGLHGLHRFYCSKPRSGALWLVSFGLLGIGQLIDLFLIPGMVEKATRRFSGCWRPICSMWAMTNGGGWCISNPEQRALKRPMDPLQSSEAAA